MTAGAGGSSKRPQASGEPGPLRDLLGRNRAWAARKHQVDPQFFRRLVRQQSPRYFWIGCSDSRVPATEIVDLDPGEMFVHRNVANLARPHEASYVAALQFAVDVLQVQHVIVVGHYGCGGVRAAMQEAADSPIDRWLAPVRALHRLHKAELDGMDDDECQDRLCELNVLEQVKRVAAHPVVSAAWRAGRDLTIHGWIYSIATGLITNLTSWVACADDQPTLVTNMTTLRRTMADATEPQRS